LSRRLRRAAQVERGRQKRALLAAAAVAARNHAAAVVGDIAAARAALTGGGQRVRSTAAEAGDAAATARLAGAGAVRARHHAHAVVGRGTAAATVASRGERIVGAGVALAGRRAAAEGTGLIGPPLPVAPTGLGCAAVAAVRARRADAAAAPGTGIADVRADGGRAVDTVGAAMLGRLSGPAGIGGGNALAGAAARRHVAEKGARFGLVIGPDAVRAARLRLAAVALLLSWRARAALAHAARGRGAGGRRLPVPGGVTRLDRIAGASAGHAGGALAAALVGGGIAGVGAGLRRAPLSGGVAGLEHGCRIGCAAGGARLAVAEARAVGAKARARCLRLADAHGVAQNGGVVRSAAPRARFAGSGAGRARPAAAANRGTGGGVAPDPCKIALLDRGRRRVASLIAGRAQAGAALRGGRAPVGTRRPIRSGTARVAGRAHARRAGIVTTSSAIALLRQMEIPIVDRATHRHQKKESLPCQSVSDADRQPFHSAPHCLSFP